MDDLRPGHATCMRRRHYSTYALPGKKSESNEYVMQVSRNISSE